MVSTFGIFLAFVGILLLAGGYRQFSYCAGYFHEGPFYCYTPMVIGYNFGLFYFFMGTVFAIIGSFLVLAPIM